MSEKMAEYASEPDAAPGVIPNMTEALGYLHDRIDLLGHRLQPVLGSEFPQAIEEAKVTGADIQLLLAEIQRASGRIDTLIARLVL